MSGSNQHHVLLIGIDAYDGDGSLAGCVNDIDAIQRLLIDRVGLAPKRITRLASPRWDAQHETDVPAQLPTLANIRSALERLGSEEVSSGDRVVVYYSGHGTQCITTDGNGRRFAREALLPKDKQVGIQRQFLFDFELNHLLAKIAARTSRVCVVLDCCSSGGLTRGDPQAIGTERFFETKDPVSLSQPVTDPSDGVLAALGRIDAVQVVSACRDDQRARESTREGRAHGELTRALVEKLATISQDALANLQWGQIWRALDLAVRKANPRQAPWLCGKFGRRVFGFEPDDDVDVGFAVIQVPTGYQIDAGHLYGITEDALIAVYGAQPAKFPPLAIDDDDARAGTIRIVETTPDTARGVAVTAFDLPDAPRGRLVQAGRGARLRVRIASQQSDLAKRLTQSPLLELVDTNEEVALLETNGVWSLVDDVHGDGAAGEPVLVQLRGAEIASAVAVLEHYLAYVTPLRMARACQDLPNALTVSVRDCNGIALDAAAAQSADLPSVHDVLTGDLVCFVVENRSDMPLSVTLLDCAASGSVYMLGEPRIPPRSRYVFWDGGVLGEPFEASLPQGRKLAVDRLVAIGTTSASSPLRGLVRERSFEDVIKLAGGTRGTKQAPVPPLQWTSATTSVRIRVKNT
jgi:hypothetical protein